MPVVDVNIEYVNQPKKPGGKYGNLNIGKDRDLIFVPVGELGWYQPGPMSVEVEHQTWGDKNVQVAVRPANGPAQQPPGDWQRPQPQMPPAPQGHNGAPNDKDKMIFVTGIVGRAMGSGQFSAADISVLVEHALEGWAAYQRGRPQQLRQPAPAHAPPPPQGQHDYGFGEEPPFG